MDKKLIDSIFAKHHEFYKQTGVEIIIQQAGHFSQVSDAYQGRVLFELLQNAFDRADSRILVKICSIEGINHLLVANDGERFTYCSNHNYLDGGNRKRYDFQALCSIATSTKDAAKFIGNKGVGFKSVFSVSRYATVYTNGMVYPAEQVEEIDFRIYDQFLSETELNDNHLEEICPKLAAVKQENKNRGIPGYYFPIQIDAQLRPTEIVDLFGQGFVTIVAIPLNESMCSTVGGKMKEMHNYQYKFIHEKYPEHDIAVTFNDGEDEWTSTTNPGSRVISRKVSPKVRELAEKINLQLDENASVSLYFREPQDGNAMVYNYMPTEIRSPFKYVDINADFQTSVNRKDIELSTSADQPIGRYNRMLLEECLNLYKEVILDDKMLAPDHFDVKYLIVDPDAKYDIFRVIESCYFNDFEDFVVDILQHRDLGNSDENYRIFYEEFMIRVIGHSHPYGWGWQPYHDKCEKIGKSIKEKDVHALPDVLSISGKQLFLCDSNQVQLPKTINAVVTSFHLESLERNGLFKSFLNGLGLKKLSQTDEILKLYRQCDLAGKYKQEESLTEEQQIELLASVASLMQIETRRNENEHISTWRFENLIETRNTKQDVSTNVQAGFALSTLFYKTKNGKYLPAQLLRQDDIDVAFLEAIKQQIGTEFDIHLLLAKTGVSLRKNYYFADLRLKEKMGEGLDFIPALYEVLPVAKYYSDALTNIRVCSENGNYHPIQINENHPSVFFNIRRTPELKCLGVAAYDNLPSEYAEVLTAYLKEKCKRITLGSLMQTDLYRFYQYYFDELYRVGIRLVKTGSTIQLSTDENYIVIADSLLLESANITTKLLCYVGSKEKLPVDLQSKYREVSVSVEKEGTVQNGQDTIEETILQKRDIQTKLLCLISQSNISERIFDEGRSIANITKILDNTIIIEVDQVNTLCTIADERPCVMTVPFFLEKSDGENTLYVEVDEENLPKSQLNIAKAIAVSIFNNEALTHLVESVLFHNTYVDEMQIKEFTRRIENVLKEQPDEIQYVFEENVEEGHYPTGQFDLNDIPEYKVSLYEHRDRDSKDAEIAEKRHISITSNGPKDISNQMIAAGFNGEKNVLKIVVSAFVKEHPTLEARTSAFEKINSFLRDNFADIRSSEIVIDATDNLVSENEIARLLWYTSQDGHRTSPFDIITYTEGKVLLIEVKSTDGNNSFRLSTREAKVAIKNKENYSVYRVDHRDCTIKILGNPLLNYAESINNNGFELVPAGFYVRIESSDRE